MIYSLVMVLCLHGQCSKSAPQSFDNLQECVEAAIESNNAVYDHSVVYFGCEPAPEALTYAY